METETEAHLQETLSRWCASRGDAKMNWLKKNKTWILGGVVAGILAMGAYFGLDLSGCVARVAPQAATQASE